MPENTTPPKMPPLNVPVAGATDVATNADVSPLRPRMAKPRPVPKQWMTSQKIAPRELIVRENKKATESPPAQVVKAAKPKKS